MLWKVVVEESDCKFEVLANGKDDLFDLVFLLDNHSKVQKISVVGFGDTPKGPNFFGWGEFHKWDIPERFVRCACCGEDFDPPRMEALYSCTMCVQRGDAVRAARKGNVV